MPYGLIDKVTFWSNAGTANLATLADNSVLWLNPGADTVTVTAATSHWKKIPLNGADRCIIQYNGKLIDRGGIGANAIASSNTAICAVGLCHDDNDAALAVPPATTVVPSSYISTAGVAEEFWGNALGFLNIGEYATATSGAFSNVPCSSIGLFADIVPVNNDIYATTIEIGHRQSGAAANTTLERGLSVSEYDTIWLAYSVLHDFNASSTLATTKLQARVLVLLYEEYQRSWPVNLNLRSRRDLKTNIAAGS